MGCFFKESAVGSFAFLRFSHPVRDAILVENRLTSDREVPLGTTYISITSPWDFLKQTLPFSTDISCLRHYCTLFFYAPTRAVVAGRRKIVII
jgi:hypothetical protein